MIVRNHRARPAWFALVCATAVGTLAVPARAFDLVEASIAGQQLAVRSVTFVVQEREVVENVEVEDNGKTRVVQVAKVVAVTVPMTEERMVTLDAVRATDAAGKPIAKDRLAVVLRQPTAAVVGDVPVDKRAIFREGTVFLQITDGP